MANNNPNYSIIIQQQGGIPIVINMPDTFAMDTASEYSTPFAQGIFGDGMLSKLASVTGTRLVSQAMTAQIWQGATESDLMLDIDLFAETDAEAEIIDVIQALLALTAPTIDPSTNMLRSPGPKLNLDQLGQIAQGATQSAKATFNDVAARFSNAKPSQLQSAQTVTNGQNSVNQQPGDRNGVGGSQFWKNLVSDPISVQIGRYAFFDSVVIKNVQKTYTHILDANGTPTHAKVQIRFCPLFLLTQGDLAKIYGRVG